MPPATLQDLTALLSGVLAAVAVVGLIRVPSRRLRWLLVEHAGRSGPSRSAESIAVLRRLVEPRPGAWSLRLRLLSGGLAGVAGLICSVAVGAHPAALRWVCVLALALATVVVTGKLEPSAVRERRVQMVIDCPHTVELLAVCLRAGLPLRSATRAVADVITGPLRADLVEVLRQIELGVPEPDAWRSLRGHPVLGRLALDLARSVESGTMLVETLHHHARDARRARRGALEARAKTVGVHSVPPLMVCFLPAFLLIGVVPTGVTAFMHALG